MFKLFRKNKTTTTTPTPLQQNRTHHESLKKAWDSEMVGAGLDVVELEEVVVSGKGVPYYTYKDISCLVMSRKTHLIQALKKLEYVVNPDWIKSTRQQLKNLLANGDIQNAQYLLNEWENRETNLPEMEVLMEVASVFFVRFDEPPYTLSEISQTKKILEVGEDFVLSNFFLSQAWELFKSQLREAYLEKFKGLEIGDLAKDWAKETMRNHQPPSNFGLGNIEN